MEIRFDTCEGKAIITIKDENIELLMDKKASIYKKIKGELEKDFIELKNFRTMGIPGKIKYKRKYKYIEDILILLRSLKNRYRAYNIVYLNKIKNEEYNIIKIDELILKSIIPHGSCIREFKNKYEYCKIEGYEEKYKDYKIDIIQFEEVFIKTVTIKEKKMVISINFIKKEFNINELIIWIKSNEIKVFSNKEEYIKDGIKVLEGIKFENNTIMLYEKGQRELTIDQSQLIKIKENLFFSKDKINIYHANKILFNRTDMDIILDGKKINYIPEIELNSKNDLLYCNGLIIEGKYIGSHEDSIGFFKDKASKEPIAWLIGTTGPIYIDNHFSGNGRIVFLKYSVDIGIEDFT